MVEPITHDDARRARAGHRRSRLQHLPAARRDDVYIDLLTDSGTVGDVRPPVGRADARRRGLCRQPQLLPPRRCGPRRLRLRGADPDPPGARRRAHLSARSSSSPATSCPGNMYFTTTRVPPGATPAACSSTSSSTRRTTRQPASRSRATSTSPSCERADRRGRCRPHPLHLGRDEREHGRRPAAVAGEPPGGVRATARATASCVMLDATRALENAWFIQQREAGYADRPSPRSCARSARYSDGATVSSKKDNLVNIGGFLALRDPELARQGAWACWSRSKACTPTAACRGATWRRWPRDRGDGRHRRPRAGAGRSGRVPRAQADRCRDSRWCSRSAVTESSSMPSAILAHLPQDQFPAQALAAAIYRRLRGPRHGARHRVGRARPGDRREPPPQAGTGAPDDPAPGLHPGAHGRDRRVGDRRSTSTATTSRACASPTSRSRCDSSRRGLKKSKQRGASSESVGSFGLLPGCPGTR